MDLPFTREQFFDIFARYNEAVWPAQVLLFAAALACIAILRSASGSKSIVGWALAAFMAWSAIVYHLAFFTAVNPAAWLFGALMLAGAFVLAWQTRSGRLRFDGSASPPSRIAGWTMIVYALAAYPILAMLSGQWYPRLPTFGAPCPTTIFVLGMLLLARPPVPIGAFVVPIVWSIVATSAAVALGVPEDFGLPVAAAVAIVVAIVPRWRDRRSLPRAA
jgi:hypothetical protein